MAQDPIIAEVEGLGEFEFPAGTDPAVIQATIQRAIAASKPSGLERAVRGFGHEFIESVNPIPAIKGIYGALTSGSLANPQKFAELTAAQRAAGSEMQGRSMADIGRTAGEQFKQSSVPETLGRMTGQAAGLFGVPELVGLGMQRTAPVIMRAAMSPPIQRKFPDVDLAKVALRERAVPGKKGSTEKIAQRTGEAGQALRRTAQEQAGGRRVQATQALSGVRNLEAEALNARKLDRAEDIRNAMADAETEYGPEGLDTAQALARKQILQQEGRTALNAPSTRQAPLDPQVANAERAALTGFLRESPEMASALDRSQEMIGLNRVMKHHAPSTIFSRARLGGVAAALASPTGAGYTANALDLIGQNIRPSQLMAQQPSPLVPPRILGRESRLLPPSRTVFEMPSSMAPVGPIEAPMPAGYPGYPPSTRLGLPPARQIDLPSSMEPIGPVEGTVPENFTRAQELLQQQFGRTATPTSGPIAQVPGPYQEWLRQAILKALQGPQQ